MAFQASLGVFQLSFGGSVSGKFCGGVFQASFDGSVSGEFWGSISGEFWWGVFQASLGWGVFQVSLGGFRRVFGGAFQVSFAVHLRRIVAFNMLLSAETDSELS